MALELSEKAARPLTAVQDCVPTFLSSNWISLIRDHRVSTYVSVTPLDISKETAGHSRHVGGHNILGIFDEISVLY